MTDRKDNPGEGDAKNALALYEQARVLGKLIGVVRGFMESGPRPYSGGVALHIEGQVVAFPPDHAGCKDVCELALAILDDDLTRIKRALKSYGFDPDDVTKEG